MKKNLFKSIVALMVLATAMVMTSCSDDNALTGINLDDELTAVYSLFSSEHVTTEGIAAVNDSLRITCGHKALFTAKNADDITKTYRVYNAAKLDNTEVIVENFSDIENKSFNWSNGKFNIGKSVITLVFGETYATSVKVSTKTYTIPELSYCTVKAVVLEVKNIENGVANATLIFTLSCGDEAEYNLTFPVTESHKEVLTYTYDDATVTGPGTGNVVRHNFVDGVEKGTDNISVVFDCNLSAEAKKTTADLTAIAFNGVAATATKGTYRASWNVVSHELYAQYPETVSFVDNGESHTVALKADWNVKFISKDTIDNSTEDTFVYNTTANYNLVANNTIVMASAAQEIEQRDAKNTQKITVSYVGEDENGVKIRLFIDNSKEADVEKFFYAPSGLSVKTESAKRIETTPVTLAQTGRNAGNWNKGAQQTTSDNVKYNTYSRVDSYIYNNGKVSSNVTYTKNDNYVVVWEGKEYKVEMGDAAIVAGTPKETANNSDNNIISKTFTVNHSIARGNVSANADQMVTLWKNRMPNTIPGYYAKAAAMTDIYNADRTAPARRVICAEFVEINGSNTLYVEFDTKGNEISRHANVNVSNDGIMSMVWNGAAFVPGKLTGVTSTSANPQEWLYTSYANADIQGYISPMSVTKHSLKNPYIESGIKKVVDGEEFITIGNVTLK